MEECLEIHKLVYHGDQDGQRLIEHENGNKYPNIKISEIGRLYQKFKLKRAKYHYTISQRGRKKK